MTHPLLLRDYIEKKQIKKTLHDLIGATLLHVPEDPVLFLLDTLISRQAVKQAERGGKMVESVTVFENGHLLGGQKVELPSGISMEQFLLKAGNALGLPAVSRVFSRDGAEYTDIMLLVGGETVYVSEDQPWRDPINDALGHSQRTVETEVKRGDLDPPPPRPPSPASSVASSLHEEQQAEYYTHASDELQKELALTTLRAQAAMRRKDRKLRRLARTTPVLLASTCIPLLDALRVPSAVGSGPNAANASSSSSSSRHNQSGESGSDEDASESADASEEEVPVKVFPLYAPPASATAVATASTTTTSTSQPGTPTTTSAAAPATVADLAPNSAAGAVVGSVTVDWTTDPTLPAPPTVQPLPSSHDASAAPPPTPAPASAHLSDAELAYVAEIRALVTEQPLSIQMQVRAVELSGGDPETKYHTVRCVVHRGGDHPAIDTPVSEDADTRHDFSDSEPVELVQSAEELIALGPIPAYWLDGIRVDVWGIPVHADDKSVSDDTHSAPSEASADANEAADADPGADDDNDGDGDDVDTAEESFSDDADDQ
eukprot:gnl/Spiro4/21067_TR10275_c0_g1_i3.p2 gnl/Spiro4/21067_TR10275_c0_g1~~gnl/Spiro4/21067_TR10275_c0_g1_i3.p2  ORF type:complete len:546 (+),score=156.05 gnl/Spiro4/21067_TR10275_c0_g1_i3:27-1664(+)